MRYVQQNYRHIFVSRVYHLHYLTILFISRGSRLSCVFTHSVNNQNKTILSFTFTSLTGIPPFGGVLVSVAGSAASLDPCLILVIAIVDGMPMALRIDLSDIFSKYETTLFKLISAMFLCFTQTTRCNTIVTQPSYHGSFPVSD